MWREPHAFKSAAAAASYMFESSFEVSHSSTTSAHRTILRSQGTAPQGFSRNRESKMISVSSETGRDADKCLCSCSQELSVTVTSTFGSGPMVQSRTFAFQ